MSASRVLVVMGSSSDLPVMAETRRALTELGLDCELAVASAHRTPARAEEPTAPPVSSSSIWDTGWLFSESMPGVRENTRGSEVRVTMGTASPPGSREKCSTRYGWGSMDT